VTNRSRLFNLGLLLCCWIFSVCIFFILSANDKFNIPLRYQPENCNFDLTLPANRSGAFNYTRFNPEKKYQPVYSVAFENLLLKNNNFGPFKTAMHQKAMIHGLELRFYQYAPAAETKPADAEKLIEEIANASAITSNRFSIGNINFARVSEVHANNFDCRFFYKDSVILSVHSGNAAASYENSDIELRGHVIIKTQDGGVLESNYVKWDIHENTFNVKSAYRLNHNGVVKTGRNACFDFTLNEVLPHQAKNYVKEEYKCIAGL
jgi:hypothetical protein